MPTTTPLDILKGLQSDLAGLNLSDPHAQEMALELIHRMEHGLDRINKVREAMLNLSSEQFSDETETEKAFFDSIPQHRIDEMDAILLGECRGVHPVFKSILDAVSP